MIKLLIVDDERIMRETLATLIDWKQLGIELVGSCKDGFEAYDSILDLCPDIVLTDIRMPGLNGIELIQKLHEANACARFIILSGYDEFEYAQEAMRYGVRYYLLKPCNEAAIIHALKEVSKDCYHRLDRGFSKEQAAQNRLNEDMLYSLLYKAASTGDAYAALVEPYQKYLDFDYTPYDIYQIAIGEALSVTPGELKKIWKMRKSHYLWYLWKVSYCCFFKNMLKAIKGLNRDWQLF
ncbi:MAG: response regulator [Eubacteriales bacterium]|nr:response regulator [Eubacteriales bacterium]